MSVATLPLLPVFGGPLHGRYVRWLGFQREETLWRPGGPPLRVVTYRLVCEGGVTFWRWAGLVAP